MDPKIGPQQVFKSSHIDEISHQEIVAIFATHNIFTEGFRGVHVGDRTWATYVKPPWIIGLLLSEDEPIGPLGDPMQKMIQQADLDEQPTSSQWEQLHQSILQEIQSSPVADLLTSTRTVEFLQTLIEQGISFFDPHFNFAIGTIYLAADRLTGLNSYDTRLFLEKLTLAGIFSSEPVAGITYCPICHGFKVVSRLACPQCSTTAHDIVRATNLVGEAEAKSFPSATTPNPYYTCRTCSYTTEAPLVSLLCTECGSQFLPREADYRNMNRLVLNVATAKALIEQVENSKASGP